MNGCGHFKHVWFAFSTFRKGKNKFTEASTSIKVFLIVCIKFVLVSNLNFDMIKMVCILTFKRRKENVSGNSSLFLFRYTLWKHLGERHSHRDTLKIMFLCISMYVLDVKMPSSPNDKAIVNEWAQVSRIWMLESLYLCEYHDSFWIL